MSLYLPQSLPVILYLCLYLCLSQSLSVTVCFSVSLSLCLSLLSQCIIPYLSIAPLFEPMFLHEYLSQQDKRSDGHVSARPLPQLCQFVSGSGRIHRRQFRKVWGSWPPDLKTLWHPKSCATLLILLNHFRSSVPLVFKPWHTTPSFKPVWRHWSYLGQVVSEPKHI